MTGGPIRVVELFSGIGAQMTALVLAGFPYKVELFKTLQNSSKTPF